MCEEALLEHALTIRELLFQTTLQYFYLHPVPGSIFLLCRALIYLAHLLLSANSFPGCAIPAICQLHQPVWMDFHTLVQNTLP